VESQYHFDALGSTLALTDGNEQVTDAYAYTAFGEVTETTGNTRNPFQYVGQRGYYTNVNIGGVAVRRRILASLSTRWMSSDPFGAFADNVEEHVLRHHGNVYQYVNNAPLNSIDPSGLVDLILDPTEPDSMPWYKKRLPGAGKVGNTAANTKVDLTSFKKDRVTKKVKCCFTLSGTAKIELDIDKIKTLAPKNRKLTPETAYGHEQLHVTNFIIIMERGKALLEECEKKEYDTAEDATKACTKCGQDVAKKLRDDLGLDRDHKGKDPKSPSPGELPAPIGQMPKEPAG
jgi:RHS repeat-associated protein